MSSQTAADDLTIPDSAILWRRVRYDQTSFDHDQRRLRPSSKAFQDVEQGGVKALSVFLAEIEHAAGHTAGDILRNHPDFGLVAVTAGVMRACGLTIVRNPTQENPGHAHVVGKKTGSVRSKIAKSAQWVVEAPQPPES